MLDDTFLDPLTDDVFLDVSDDDTDENWDAFAWETYTSEDGN